MQFMPVMTNQLSMWTSQIFNNHTWIVTFKTEYSNEKLIGKNIEIANKRVVIMDANQDESIVNIKLRILWLPHNFRKDKINRFLKERYGLQVAEIIEEKIKHEKYQDLKIKNGNFLVKCKLDLKTNKQRLGTGINEINGNRVLISRIGGPVRYLTCNEIGHIRRACPRKNDRCCRCNRIGHLLSECTMAKRIGEHTEELPDDLEQAIEEVQNDSFLSSKPEVNSQTDEDVDSEEENTVYQQNKQGLIPVAQIEEKLKDQKKLAAKRISGKNYQRKNVSENHLTKSKTSIHTSQTQNDEVGRIKRRELISTDLFNSNSKSNNQTNSKKLKSLSKY